MYYSWGSQNNFNSTYFPIQHQLSTFDPASDLYYAYPPYQALNSFRNSFVPIPQEPQRPLIQGNYNSIKEEEDQNNKEFDVLYGKCNVKLQNDGQKKIRNEDYKNIKIWNQKKGRNINSNIFRAMLKFLLSETCSKEYLKKVIFHHKIKISAEHYQCEIRQMTKKLKNHVRNQQIEQFLCGNHEEEEVNLITRVVMKIYLKKIHVLYAFNSKKIQDETRPLHLIFCQSLLRTVLK